MHYLLKSRHISRRATEVSRLRFWKEASSLFTYCVAFFLKAHHLILLECVCSLCGYAYLCLQIMLFQCECNIFVVGQLWCWDKNLLKRRQISVCHCRRFYCFIYSFGVLRIKWSLLWVCISPFWAVEISRKGKNQTPQISISVLQSLNKLCSWKRTSHTRCDICLYTEDKEQNILNLGILWHYLSEIVFVLLNRCSSAFLARELMNVRNVNSLVSHGTSY